MNRRDLVLHVLNIGAVQALFGQDPHPPVNDDTQGSGMAMPKLAGTDQASDALMAKAIVASQTPSVLTPSGSNLRHGPYLNETQLPPDAIRANGLRKRYT